VGRVPRTSLPDGYFHVFSRCIPSAGLVFRDDEDREIFLELVWRAARRHGWTCHAICLMGSHYHLVLETERESLSAGLHRLNSQYAMYFNRKHDAFGHVFASRYSARVIESEQYLYDACAYVLLNPVRAGLCDRIDDWPWSYSSYGLGVS
jgi:REP-associated tyrosine transposase